MCQQEARCGKESQASSHPGSFPTIDAASWQSSCYLEKGIGKLPKPTQQVR